MEILSLRGFLATRALVAHVIGLTFTGVVMASGNSTGYAGAVSLALFLGGLLSLPWMACLGIAIWFWADRIYSHRLAFSIIGPVTTCATWWLVAGEAFLYAVAISAGVSALCFLGFLSVRKSLQAQGD